MQFEDKKTMLAAGLLLSVTTFNANASLTSYTGAGGAGLIYSSVSNVTWTQDANLFKTLYDANNNLISQIAAVTPTYNDSYWGLQTIDADDFDTANGQMSWWGGLAFVNYLNSTNYGGSSQWSLPSWTDTGAAGPQYGFNGTDAGYNVNTSSSELAALYYDELGAKAYFNTSGSGPQSGYNILGNGIIGDTIGSVGAFDNVHAYAYWLGSEYSPSPGYAWRLFTHTGDQGGYSKYFGKFYAWAVSPGQVAAVPVPSAVWLFGSSLIGLLGFKQRGNKA